MSPDLTAALSLEPSLPGERQFCSGCGLSLEQTQLTLTAIKRSLDLAHCGSAMNELSDVGRQELAALCKELGIASFFVVKDGRRGKKIRREHTVAVAAQ